MSSDREHSHRREALPTTETPDALATGGVRVGRIVTVDEIGNAQVSFEGAPSANGCLPALSTLALTSQDVGRRVVLAFEGPSQKSPIIMGRIHEPLDALIDPSRLSGDGAKAEAPLETAPISEAHANEQANPKAAAFEAVIDDDRVVLTAEKEIVLRCGASSITLRKDGRVLIRGKNVVSRSSGPNRIKGASVQVN